MSKKLNTGVQLPQNNWQDRSIREIKVTANSTCPMINIKVGSNKMNCTWLVDSGARESIIDHASFKEIFPDAILEPLDPGIKFSQADGSPLNVLGSFITEFWFNKEPMSVKLYICKGVTKTLLLGANILSKFPSWGVDNMAHYFLMGDLQIPLVKTVGEAPSACDVLLTANSVIPPKCSCFVQASLPHRYNQTEFIFKPSDRMFDKHKLLLPVCLVANNLFDSRIRVKVSNPLDSQVTINKGTKIGRISNNVGDYNFLSKDDERTPIRSVGSSVTPSTLKMKLRKEHPELYKLYEESCDLLKEEQRDRLLKLLWTYQHVFSKNDNDIGTTTVVKHEIIPRSDKVIYRRQYKHTEQQHQEIDKEVQKLLDSGVIRESMSPFNSPVLMVPKKETGKWRFCLDCRYINDLTEDQYFPIPRVDEVMDSLSGMEVFSVVDMTAGYHQVPLEGKTSEMCAFSTRKGHFQYTKLPMGLRGSGMTFQKMVTLLLSGMLHSEVLAYLDDCVLFSKTIMQHMEILEEVLRRFGDANLKLKPRKCHLFKGQIVYLGFLIDKTGIRPDPERTNLISQLHEPCNVTEVQRFLGKANYYRKFIPQLAKIAHPLYELTVCKGKDKFCWQAEHQSAFDQIKAILVSGQVMGHPRLDREFVLDVDASDFALGAELSQADENGDLRPIYYASKHLEKSERNYSATAREALAAVFGCEYFRQYLQGAKFKLRTDHNPLVWLRNMKEPKRPYSGWIVRLEQFNYQMEYRPGKEHTNADFNSRVQVQDDRKSIGTQTTNELTVCNEIDTKRCSTVNWEVGIKESNSSRSSQPLQATSKGLGGERNSTPREDQSKEELIESNVTLKVNQKNSAPTEDNNKNKDFEPQSSSQNNQKCQTGERNSTPIERNHRSEGITNEDLSNMDTLPEQVLRTQQLSDNDIGPIVNKLQGSTGDIGELTKAGQQLWRVRKNLLVKEGVLVRTFKLKAGLKPIEQIVLPASLRQVVLESLHDSPFAGHFGEHRTLARVKLRYYWPGYVEDVANWCKTCEVCQRRKNPVGRNSAPMTSIDTGKGPFEHIALDLLKLPITERGNQYLLVIEDYFSKWVEAFPLLRTNAPSVAQCVLNGWIARFGCPYSILSDQGREFESKLFKALNEMLNTKKLKTTTYHPRTDGMVERSNRTIIDVLSKYCEKEPDWDLKIPLVLFAIRTSEHSTTGFSPFALTYGREARIPWDIVYGSPPNTLMPLEEWVAERKKHMTKVFQMVQEHTKKRQLQQKRYFDSNLKGELHHFTTGELVMMLDCAARSKYGKLNSPWVGPFRVVDKLSDCLYKIETGENKSVIVNVEKLKKYFKRGDGLEKTNLKKNTESLDEESEVEDLEDDDEEDEIAAPGIPPQPGNVQEGNTQNQPQNNQEQTPPREPLMGHRGQYWCNLDQRNILNGGRRD